MENNNVNDKTIEIVYEKLDDLNRKIDRFLESHIEIKTRFGIAEERIKDFESRLRGLESSDKKWATVSIIVSAVVTIVVTIGAFLIK